MSKQVCSAICWSYKIKFTKQMVCIKWMYVHVLSCQDIQWILRLMTFHLTCFQTYHTLLQQTALYGHLPLVHFGIGDDHFPPFWQTSFALP